MPDSLRQIRAVTLCGSVKPYSSGIDDFSERLNENLNDYAVVSQDVDIGRWGLRDTLKLLRSVAEAKPDVIFMQYPTDAFGKGLAPHCFSALQRIAPLVITLHEFSEAHLLRRLSVLLLVARARHVVLTTETERKALHRFAPWLKSRTSIIPIGSNIPASGWNPGPDFEVVHFGQIRANKGIESFVEAATLARDRGLPVRFTLVGSSVPRFAAFFDKIRAEADAAGVTVRQNPSDQEVAGLLAGASVCYLPFPDGATMRRSTLLAAAQIGVPVLTRFTEETPDELRRLATEADTPAAAVDIIERLCRDREVLRDASRKSATLAETTGWPAIARSYREVLDAASGLGAHYSLSRGMS